MINNFTELKEEEKKEQEKAHEILSKWSEERYFEVDDKTFKVNVFSHERRLKIFSYYSQIESSLIIGNYGFLDEPKFKEILKLIEDNIIYEDIQISKIPNFWENNAEYFLKFIEISFRVICYPFFKKKASIN